MGNTLANIHREPLQTVEASAFTEPKTQALYPAQNRTGYMMRKNEAKGCKSGNQKFSVNECLREAIIEIMLRIVLAESRTAAHTLKHGASPLCCCAEYLIATTSCKKTAGGSECTPMACIPSSDAAAPPSCAALDIARRRGSFPVLAPNRDPVVNDERTAGHGDRSGIMHSMDRVPAPTSMIDAVLSSA